MNGSDRGSTAPLLLGFFMLALLMSAGAVAAGQAFVQQRDLQDLCDGAATAAAASAADIDRGRVLAGDALQFAGAQAAIDTYLRREAMPGVDAVAVLGADRRSIRLQCTRTSKVAFGAVFGKRDGVRHVVTSSVEAPIT